MTKAEVLALGVPETGLKKFQDKYNRDVQRAARHNENGSIRSLRGAIQSMLPLIREEDGLREILCVTTGIYSRQYRKAEEKQ